MGFHSVSIGVSCFQARQVLHLSVQRGHEAEAASPALVVLPYQGAKQQSRDPYSSRLPGPHSTGGPSQLLINPIIPDVCGQLPWSWVSEPCRGKVWCTSSSNHFSCFPHLPRTTLTLSVPHKYGSDFCSIQTCLLHCCLMSLYLVGQDLPRSDLLAISYSEQAEQSKSLEVSGTLRGCQSRFFYTMLCNTMAKLSLDEPAPEAERERLFHPEPQLASLCCAEICVLCEASTGLSSQRHGVYPNIPMC